METSKLEERAREKLARKHLDLIAANNVKVEGAGFGTDTNVVTMITADRTIRLEKMTKEEVAVKLLDLMNEISGFPHTDLTKSVDGNEYRQEPNIN